MKRISVFLVGALLCFGSIAQTTINGKVTDVNTGEALIGATVIYGKGKGTAPDLDGNYSFHIQQGERNLKVSYVGYEEISKIIIVSDLESKS